MNCVKDIIPVLIYKGVSKDNLRRIIRAVASDESRDSSILVNNKTSCNLTEIRQSSTMPHLQIHSDCSKAEDNLLHQESIVQPIITKQVTHTNPRPLATRTKEYSNRSSSELSLFTKKNEKLEAQEKSFCIVVTLKNNLKQAEAKRETFCHANENILRAKKSCPFSVEELKKSTKTAQAKKDLHVNCINLYSYDRQNYLKKQSPETINKGNQFNTSTVQISLPERDSVTTETCILSPEENSEYRKYTCEVEQDHNIKRPSISLKNQVKELGDIDYIQKDIKNKNLELMRLSEKDLKRSEKVMRHTKQLFNLEKPVAPMIQCRQSETNMYVLKNSILEQVNQNIKKSGSHGNFTTLSNKQHCSRVMKNKKCKTLYERLQSGKIKIFVNALSSVPKKPNGLKKSDSEIQRKIEVPPLKYIYMDRLNENLTDFNSLTEKNHFLADAKNFLQVGSTKPMKPLSHYTTYGYGKKDFWSQEAATLGLMELNTDKHNTLKFPYKHFLRDDKKTNQSVPKVEKNVRTTLHNKMLKTNKIEKKSGKMNLKQNSQPNKWLSKKVVKTKELCDYTPTDFFLGRTVFPNKDDSTGMAKQFDKSFVKYKIDLEPFNVKREFKNSQESRTMLSLPHLSHQKKKESNDSLTESFSTQYRKIENDRAQQLKQVEYARGIY